MYNTKDKGFTIIELMVSVVISSIIAITVGMMAYLFFLNWHNNNNAVELQRDATVVMDMLSRAIRPSRDADIEVPDPAHSLLPSIRIGNRSFYKSGNILWYDPDNSVTGDETRIVKEYNEDRVELDTLTFIKDSSLHYVTVTMVLGLEDGSESLALDSVISYRN